MTFETDSQLTTDRLDRLALYKKRTADLRNRLHNQHPNLGSHNHGSQCGPSAPGVPIGRRLPRKRGPYSTPKHRWPRRCQIGGQLRQHGDRNRRHGRGILRWLVVAQGVGSAIEAEIERTFQVSSILLLSPLAEKDSRALQNFTWPRQAGKLTRLCCGSQAASPAIATGE